ncbi:hypothetical protein FB567DRAFT_586115 [Paraphoma chrysanthemicola]|uniref:BTB domain-containing protein n=1 Tax=Paraphoma chrysanthemicola TaxID=798071 RepID=A0A8K0RGY9_9PLEO|nr:hypothetical protein FB567DRAFT_586115 [Paraphoma chrysanthemicola]
MSPTTFVKRRKLDPYGESVEIDLMSSDTSKTYVVFQNLTVACGGGFGHLFKQPNVCSVKVRDLSAQTLEMFLAWLHHENLHHSPFTLYPRFRVHSGRVPLKYFNLRYEPLLWDEKDLCVWELFDAVIPMFLFAETWDIPRLRQDAVDRLVWCNNYFRSNGTYDGFVASNTITMAYDRTKPKNPLRRLIAIAFCLHNTKHTVAVDEMPRQFLVDIWKHEKYMYATDENQELNPCEFHEHASKEESKACTVRVRMSKRTLDDEEEDEVSES